MLCYAAPVLRLPPRRALLREPALHFVAAASLLAAIHHAVGERMQRAAAPVKGATAALDAARPMISVNPEVLARLQARRAAMDPAARPTLSAMVDAWIDEEVLAREAQKLSAAHEGGLSRPRMVRWMLSVLQARVHVVEPTEPTLRAHYGAHLDAFTAQPRFDFELVTLPAADAADPYLSVDAALTALDGGADPATLRDARFDRWERLRPATMARTFGPRFTRSVEASRLGVWRSVENGDRPTLLRVLRAHPGGGVLPFDTVRRRVRLHHSRALVAAAVADQLVALRRRYRIAAPPLP